MAERLTEDQIERRVEGMINRLDRRLMQNELSQEEYDLEYRAVARWAREQYQGRAA